VKPQFKTVPFAHLAPKAQFVVKSIAELTVDQHFARMEFKPVQEQLRLRNRREKAYALLEKMMRDGKLFKPQHAAEHDLTGFAAYSFSGKPFNFNKNLVLLAEEPKAKGFAAFWALLKNYPPRKIPR